VPGCKLHRSFPQNDRGGSAIKSPPLSPAGLVDDARARAEEAPITNSTDTGIFGGGSKAYKQVWAHGVSGRPMGFARQSWSSAMYIYAHETVRTGKPPFFIE
jgi:hypothetical protein